jgi:hypothetical protein
MNSTVLKLFASGLNSNVHAKQIHLAYLCWGSMDVVSAFYYRGFMRTTEGMSQKARLRLLCDLCFDLALQIDRSMLVVESSHIFVFIRMIKESHKVFRQARWLHFQGYVESVLRLSAPEQIQELCKLSTELVLFNNSPEVLIPKVVL